jgi:hypothetical protein
MRSLIWVAAGFWLAGTSATQAQDATFGRWAANDAACSSWSGDGATDTPMTVSTYAIIWYQGFCRVGRMYKTDKGTHIEAHCWNSNEDRSTPVTLQPMSGDRLKAVWNRGTPAVLKRCQ